MVQLSVAVASYFSLLSYEILVTNTSEGSTRTVSLPWAGAIAHATVSHFFS